VELSGFNGDLEQISCATRLASACHSIAISVHALLMAGSVAFRAKASLASALNRNRSETLIIVMLHDTAGAQHSQSPVTAKCCGDIEPTLQVVMRSKFVSVIAHTVVLRVKLRVQRGFLSHQLGDQFLGPINRDLIPMVR
jgi:hypothetical protein